MELTLPLSRYSDTGRISKLVLWRSFPTCGQLIKSAHDMEAVCVALNGWSSLGLGMEDKSSEFFARRTPGRMVNRGPYGYKQLIDPQQNSAASWVSYDNQKSSPHSYRISFIPSWIQVKLGIHPAFRFQGLPLRHVHAGNYRVAYIWGAQRA